MSLRFALELPVLYDTSKSEFGKGFGSPTARRRKKRETEERIAITSASYGFGARSWLIDWFPMDTDLGIEFSGPLRAFSDSEEHKFMTTTGRGIITGNGINGIQKQGLFGTRRRTLLLRHFVVFSETGPERDSVVFSLFFFPTCFRAFNFF